MLKEAYKVCVYRLITTLEHVLLKNSIILYISILLCMMISVLFLPLRVLGAYIREYRIITLLTSKYFFDDTLVMNNHL